MKETDRKVVVLGGGFGGLSVTKMLKKAPVSIALIDKKNHHVFQPLLYQVASAALSPADIATPLREIFSRQSNVEVMMATAKSIDVEKNQVFFVDKEPLSYDTLVIATGARHSYFGKNQWECLAPGLKTVKDALTIREHILLSFEKAERIGDPKKAEPFLHFVIIGAGPTGVEMAGAIAEVAYQTLFKNFRRINPKQSKIYLIEGAPRVLPGFHPKLSEKAKKTLEKMGVIVLTHKLVTNIDQKGVHIGDLFIDAHNVIWAAGNQASPLLETLDIPLDRQGRAIVHSDLSIPSHPHVFVIGDAAHVLGKDEAPLPGIAPVAIQQAHYVARLIKKQLIPKNRPPFTYFDKGSIATIGKNRAVGAIKGFRFSGFFAWIIWGVVHVFYLVSFRSRFTVMLNWVFHYTTGLRGARLIHQSIDETLSKKPPDQEDPRT